MKLVRNLFASRHAPLAAAVVAAFAVGYLGGHGGFGAPGSRVAVVRAETRDASASVVPVAAVPEAPPARPASGKLPSRLSPPLDPLQLPALKAYDLSRYAGRVIESAPGRTNKIALTFDDGPSDNTRAIVKILADHGAKGTFFFCGARMVGREAESLAVVRQGSEVGNHTWDHVSLAGLSPAEFDRQVLTTQREILRVTGVQSQFVRPRGGRFDDAALARLGRLGLVTAGWNTDSHDSFLDAKSADDIESITAHRAAGGAIVLFHEVNPKTVEALPGILDRLEAQGYTLVTLSDLLTAP